MLRAGYAAIAPISELASDLEREREMLRRKFDAREASASVDQLQAIKKERAEMETEYLSDILEARQKALEAYTQGGI